MIEEQAFITLLEKMDEDSQVEIESKTEELFKEALESIINRKLSDDILEFDDKTFRSLIVKFRINKHAELQRAYYLGVWKTLFDMMNKAIIENENSFVWQSSYSSYKYLKPFIICLYHGNVMNHTEIAEHLDIKKNALSNFLKRIENYNFYNVKKFGKNKLYSITNYGRSLYNMICEKGNSKLGNEDFSDFIIRLLKAMSNELEEAKPSTERILCNVSEGNNNTIYFTKSKSIKKEITSILSNVRNHIVRNSNFVRNERFIHIECEKPAEVPKMRIYYLQSNLETNYIRYLETPKELNYIGSNKNDTGMYEKLIPSKSRLPQIIKEVSKHE